MIGKDLIKITLIAVTYYYFSDEFFKFSAEIKQKRASFPSRFFCFLFVYFWFVLASYMELPLVVNWFVFLILLGLEIHVVFDFDFLVSYGLSLFYIILGLAVNVFFRNLSSILLEIPLSAFDNVKYTLKSYPIFVGFLVMALLLYILRKIQFPTQLQRMLYYRKSLIFYTWTEIFIYLFLMVQLLAYSQSGNEIGVKLWGIKSAFFSVIVLVIAIIYSLRGASLYYYMEKQHEIRRHLIQEKQDINQLWKLAYTDILTGINNRQLLNKRMEEYSRYGSLITLAFVDVNGLKRTNDQYGHMEGDDYLIRVSQILSETSQGLNIDLFRYGGDEFILISSTLNEKEITEILIRANDRIKSESTSYCRSISYGVVCGDCTEYQKLIALADHAMYQYKLDHYKNIARS